jgi:lysyl-tRNA synthetase class II
MKIKPKRYIVWSVDEIDLDNPWQRKWYIQQVLTHGRTEDVQELDLEEVRKLLPDLTLPVEVRSVWNEIFSCLDK